MRQIFTFLFSLVLLFQGALAEGSTLVKPTLFLIGDSTVKNPVKGQKGWGECLAEHFDLTKISIENHALGGRSSRSYLREGLWDAVMAKLKKGDFVIMQFGHNDGGPVDKEKARASLKGNFDEGKEVTIQETGVKETVHSYGWYLRKYATDAATKGASVIICSPIPRNIWTAETVNRNANDQGKWASEAAAGAGAQYVDLNKLIADKYDSLGRKKVGEEMFDPTDHTHTTPAGAAFNAATVVEGIKLLKDPPLVAFLKSA